MDVSTLTLLVAMLVFATVATLAWLCYQTLATVKETLEDLQKSAVRQAKRVAENDGEQSNTAGLRLQACERFTLMTERIAVPNLLLRLPTASGVRANEYTATLLLTIREEFEYNVTQQIYVSDALWSVLLQARDNVSQLIVRAADGAESGQQVASRLRLMSANQPADAIALAQAAIRREATQILL